MPHMYHIRSQPMSDEKKSSALNFRVPGSFRAEVDALAEQTGWELADICRMGLLAFWPDIKALIRASGTKPAEDTKTLREFIELCRTAQQRGIDPKKALADALAAKLEADARNEPQLAAAV